MTAIMAVAAVAVFAANPLTLKQGDKKFLKNAKGGALLEFIYDGATYDDRMPLTEKFPDIDKLKKLSWDGFVEEFNERCKTVKVVTKAEEANYKFTVKVTKIDQFINVMGFIPGPCVRAWGTLTVSDLKSGESLLVLDIDEIDGGSNPSPDGAYSDCFEELGKLFVKQKYKE